MYVYVHIYENNSKLLLNSIIRICILSRHLWHFFFPPLGKNLQDDLEKQEKNLQNFGSITNQLLKECHPPVTETLTTALKDVNMR